jgi:hypothetical protein
MILETDLVQKRTHMKGKGVNSNCCFFFFQKVAKKIFFFQNPPHFAKHLDNS